MKKFYLYINTALILCGNSWGQINISSKTNEAASLNISSVPSSFPVNFALFTKDENQFVAFYDAAHTMTIASRKLSDTSWSYKKLNSKVEWDSHNYLALMVDGENLIHLVGNMHSSPLIYFRSELPLDINSMKEINYMTGAEEDVTTYPCFMYGPNKEIIFHYRYGRSGSGYEIFNVLNTKKKSWKRLLGKPLTDGQEKMNAYIQGPLLGKDNYYHIIWVWRDTPDCATNHTLSYARSKDLINWESIRGEKTELPLTIESPELYVDDTPIKGGLINIGIKIGFDSQNRILIGYHKYDPAGNTQLFLARYENEKWAQKQITDWDYRWDFNGYGTIVNELLIDSPKPSKEKGKVLFGYHHIKYGDGEIIVDEESLDNLGQQEIERDYPKTIDELESKNSGMVINKIYDSGSASDGRTYLLRWETKAPNRDRKPEQDYSESTILRLISY